MPVATIFLPLTYPFGKLHNNYCQCLQGPDCSRPAAELGLRDLGCATGTLQTHGQSQTTLLCFRFPVCKTETFFHIGVLQGLSQCLQSTFGFLDGESYAEVQIISMVTALHFY